MAMKRNDPEREYYELLDLGNGRRISAVSGPGGREIWRDPGDFFYFIREFNGTIRKVHVYGVVATPCAKK